MARIFTGLLLGLTIFANAILCFAQEQCTPEKVKAVVSYLEVNSIDEMMDQMLTEILKQVPRENQKVFSNVWRKSFDKNELKSVMSNGMCRNFTLKEIKALTKFYGSPVGKSVMKKFPQYMGELMPYLQTINQRAMQNAIEEFQKKQVDDQKKPGKS